MLKTCSKCRIEKSLAEFYKNKSESTGYNCQCKECHRISAKASRSKRLQNPIMPVTDGTKICTKCNESLHVTEFYACYTASDGRDYRCKRCADTATKQSNSKRDPEAVRTIKRAWYQTHRELGIKRAKQYHKDHPEWSKRVRKQAFNRRRARKAAVPVNDFTNGEWLVLLDEFSGMCAYCGEAVEAPEQDHIIPISTQGSHTYENIVPACKPCNSRKQARPVAVFMQELTGILPMNSGLGGSDIDGSIVIECEQL